MAVPTPPPVMRRVRVVGNSGSGKTTFAAALADRLGVRRIELDEVFWDTDWRYRDPEQARAHLEGLLAGPGRSGWVVDGNWNDALQGLLGDADAVVFLDLPRRTVMRRVIWRTAVRGVTRRELWHGNRERLRNLLKRDPDDNIVLWAWTQHAVYRERYRALAARDPRVIRLRSPREVRRFLASVRPSA